MKKTDINKYRELSKQKLRNKINETRKEVARLRMEAVGAEAKDTSVIPLKKKEIARMLTILNEMRIARKLEIEKKKNG